MTIPVNVNGTFGAAPLRLGDAFWKHSSQNVKILQTACGFWKNKTGVHKKNGKFQDCNHLENKYRTPAS